MIRADLEDEVDEIRARIAFDVELDMGLPSAQRLCNVPDIVRGDVPSIGARVHRDSRRTCRHADVDRLEHVRQTPATRVPQRGHFVHVNGEA